MMYFSELDARSVRERVDMAQIWEAWLEAEARRRHSFAGYLDWEERSGREYLYSRKKGVVRSVGRRSPETERVRDAFHAGREKNAARLAQLGGEMNRQAAVLRTLGLGRLPVPAARILRAIRLAAPAATTRVIGTNALYVYEAMAGVMFNAASTATGDIDILVDDRNRLKILTEDHEKPGLASLIHREVDRSFRPRGPRDFRLTNNEGYMVEFVRPEPRPIYRNMPGVASLAEGDVEPAPIGGLQWLVNAPLVETVVIDERGFPTPMRAADPRFWAAHKFWLAEREDRDPQKKIRDRQQALVLIDLIASKLPQLSLHGEFKSMLPGALRPLFEAALEREANSAQSSPDW
ncbi:GSU2403 family nucleotidyltransferase fold protein [Brevirhabdus sp.]|uniref:GSU2403 family nucleotidyltransferase fold protein n=1 Tax=Brevirhabdus sp. TaxID=2004514 RepID=UPI00405816D5